MREFILWCKSKFKKSREQQILETCGNVCYCQCGEPLNDKSSCIKIGHEIDGLYEYACANCKETIRFHFGVAPVPIKWENTDVKN